jgi:hypothetical protein
LLGLKSTNSPDTAGNTDEDAWLAGAKLLLLTRR